MTPLRTRAAGTVALVVLIVVTALAGCEDDSSPGAPVGPPSTAAVPVDAPPVRACYRIDVAAGLELSSAAPRVSCTKRHTSVTVRVGRIKRTTEGRVVPMESARAQRQVARSCKAAVDAHVGGTTERRRLSRVQAVWFSPSHPQVVAGARWFRCDLVIAGTATRFTPLPTMTRRLLESASALARYGTCGTAAPGAPGFRRVICAAKHTWRARSTIELGAGAAYLGRTAGKRADAACRDVEARRATDANRLRWSFEWPTRAQWNAGQRYGLCWTPD
ncbi:MAG: septum formation family protein [Propionibacteriales bacterium]|nr:septum formation family protein [Propionibacteriales bacterium]